jgi:hypothetical protein
MYLSLSSSYTSYACGIADSIKLYDKQNETQFFDYLVCSMKSINEILEGKKILFNTKNHHNNILGKISIPFLNFDHLYSHHDIHDISIDSLTKLTEQYTRRYNRLINTLKTNETIYFIRFCSRDVEEEQIHTFYKHINNINCNLLFKFILASNVNDLVIPSTLLNKPNFIYVNLNNYIDDDILNEKDEYLKIIKKYKYIYYISK